MIFDTSVLIEFLRGTGSFAHLYLRDHITKGESVRITAVSVTELLAGARDETLSLVTSFIASIDVIDVERDDFYHAGDIYRRCRTNGITIRNRWDCLIAAVALRVNEHVVHVDRDFDLISRVTGLPVDNVTSAEEGSPPAGESPG